MLNRQALLFSPTRDGVPSSDDAFTADDLIAAQEALEREARDVLPFKFDHCTFEKGYIKQNVYACKTCLNYSGVCQGCSIACHGEHELVELFARRNFRCDCGTMRMGAGSCCSLTKRDDAPVNRDNKYDNNFKGSFCICGVKYDPMTETDSMYQCLCCEDWLHHACLFGVSSESEEAKGPLGQDDFDVLICERCVRKAGQLHQLLERWAGVEGTGVILVGVENEVMGRAAIEEDSDENENEEDGGGAEGPSRAVASSTTIDTTTVEKRKLQEPQVGSSPSGINDERSFKKPKLNGLSEQSSHTSFDSPSESSIFSTTRANPAPSSQPSESLCKAPPIPSGRNSSPLAKLLKAGGKVNVYLEEGWMQRWCRCDECLPFFDDFDFLLEEEEIYEPPLDPDAHKPTLELGMDALLRMPRERAIEGALAFQGLSQRLKAFLKPYSDAHQTITKELIDSFFEEEKHKSGV